MFSQPFDFEMHVEASLATVDAEMSAQAFLRRDHHLWIGRQEITPGLLIGYRVFHESGLGNYGECGWILLQHVDAGRTLFSFKTMEPAAGDIELYSETRPISLPDNTHELSVETILSCHKVKMVEELYLNRKRVLHEIATQLSGRLAIIAQPVVSTHRMESSRSKKAGGRPGLSEEEMIRRLALVFLERQLKRKDPGFTRGEFVFQVQQKLEMPVETHTVKNATKLLDQAQKDELQHVLSQAETLAAEWQKQFE